MRGDDGGGGGGGGVGAVAPVAALGVRVPVVAGLMACRSVRPSPSSELWRD